MGNSGSTIGDLFFPDNPSRRRRAEELKQQITLYGAEFHSLRVSRDAAIDRIRDKLDAILRDRGFNTSADLEAKVRTILNGEELAKYDALKKEMDNNEKLQSVIFDLIGIVGAASGVIAGIGVAAGVVTGGAALGAVLAVGDILAGVAAVLVVFGAIEGAVERSKLRDAIHDLWPKRAQIKQYVEQMRAIVVWVDAIEVWLKSPNTSNPSTLDNLLSATLDTQWNQWTIAHVADVLAAQDAQRGSWTNEDPGRDSLPSSPAALRAFVLSASTTRPPRAIRVAEPEKATLQLEQLSGDKRKGKGLPPAKAEFELVRALGKASCLVRQAGSVYKVTAIAFDPAKVRVEGTAFRFERVSGESATPNGMVNGAVNGLVNGAMKGAANVTVSGGLGAVENMFLGGRCALKVLGTSTA